jgi:hypothetical protein
MIGVKFPAGAVEFLFPTVSGPALEPTQLPIQWVSGVALSPGVKRPGRDADHSPPSSAKVKNAWRYTSTSPIRLHGVVLSHTDNFTSYLYLIRLSCEDRR